jgi:hypothetical protein
MTKWLEEQKSVQPAFLRDEIGKITTKPPKKSNTNLAGADSTNYKNDISKGADAAKPTGMAYVTSGANNAPYIQQLNTLYDQIMNRKPFQYDLNGDLLYRQMADQYTQLGRQASADAMGQAAALTGGYGNSYATQVGNQANQQYLTMLNQNIPELWDRAYQAYLNEGDQLLQQYELAAAHPGYVQALSPQTYAVSAPQDTPSAAGSDYNSLMASVLSGMTGGLAIPENELREWVYKLGKNDKGK